MPQHQMGREHFLAGARSFSTIWHQSPDHPVTEDFVAFMCPYAEYKPAFDLDDLRKQPLGAGGVGSMPVEIAATQGDRFDDKGAVDPGYREARTTVVLGAGEAKEVRLRCAFEPQRVVVDPDGYVMQLQRKAAAAKV